jgi:hypothetical protein
MHQNDDGSFALNMDYFCFHHSTDRTFNRGLNTSFNLKGEPIVNAPANAFNTFLRSEMDSLVLGNSLIEKHCLGRATRPASLGRRYTVMLRSGTFT